MLLKCPCEGEPCGGESGAETLHLLQGFSLPGHPALSYTQVLCLKLHVYRHLLRPLKFELNYLLNNFVFILF